MVMPYEKLDQDTRCFTLVGQFLWHWAYMESALNDAIAVALELEGPQKYIVTSNIQLRNKIRILEASVSVAFTDPEERKIHHKTLKKINNYSANRNMIAHDMFGPSDDVDGAIFLRFEANKKIEYSDTLWTIDDFKTAFRTLDGFRDAAKVMEQKLRRNNAIRKIAEALLTASELKHSSEDNEETANEGLLSLLSPTTLHSPPVSSPPADTQKPDTR